ncbi:hypothetical protein PFISCL1PPCAC_2993, partial [Pristionchus fissidentatus]
LTSSTMKSLAQTEKQPCRRTTSCCNIKCNCGLCDLLDKRRSVKSKQRNVRKQKLKELGESTVAAKSTPSYACSRCRNHGFCVPKKFHMPCPYINCTCDPCSINDHIRTIDQQIAEQLCTGNTSTPRTSSKAPEVERVAPLQEPG